MGMIQRGFQLMLDFFAPAPAEILGLVPDDLLTEQARELFREVGADPLAAKTVVAWNSRLTTTAGLAQYRKNLVTLNPKLREFGMEEIDRTLRHELAHLLAHYRAGRRRIAPHGPDWRKACRDLGLPDEKRCHDLPLPRRTVERQYFYRCKACATIYPRVRPFRKRVACLNCCRSKNGGQFHENYVLEKIAPPAAEASSHAP